MVLEKTTIGQNHANFAATLKHFFAQATTMQPSEPGGVKPQAPDSRLFVGKPSCLA